MRKARSMIRMPNSATTKVALLGGAFIRPTAMERRFGRLLRAPDHDASTGGGEASSASGDGGSGGADAGAGAASNADAGASGAALSGEGDGETSLLGGATAGASGDGDAGASQDGASGKDGDGAGDKATEHVVPEAYELSVEGVDLDKAAIEEATPFFKEAGLSNDQANKIMPAAVKFRDSVANQTLQQIVDAGAKQKADWAEAAKSDPDIGGGKLEESLHLSAKALDALGYPEGSDFRKVLTETGFGNHPEMVRIFRQIGGMVSEDGFPRPGATPASQASVEKRLYPND